MRLPLFDPTAAMPELDGLTDAQRQLLLDRARLHFGLVSSGGCVAYPLLFVILFSALSLVGGALLGVLASALRGTGVGRGQGKLPLLDNDDVLSSITIVVALVLSVLFVVMARDGARRSAVRAQLRRSACPGCGATLLCERRTPTGVVCGACGVETDYAALELHPDDLGPPLFLLTPDAACRGCGYRLVDLPIAQMHVMCPECGRRERVGDDAAADS